MKVIAKKEVINQAGTPTDNCHASTVLPLDNGEILASWFGGTKEGKDDVRIFVSKRVDGVWQTPVKIAVDEETPHWNPVLFKLNDGRIALYFKYGKSIDLVWKTYVVYSEDNGNTWTAPAELVEGDTTGGRGPVKNKPIYLADGTLLAPASHEPSKETWAAFCDISKDNGKTWEMSAYVPTGEGEDFVPMIQPTLWQDDEGNVHMLLRTSKEKVFKSDSADGGRTWCKAYDTGLLNPNSGIDLVKDDKEIYLVYNPTDKNWGDRTPLLLAVSKDNGNSWETVLTLEEAEVGREEDVEYSYPAITAHGGKLHITYTYNRVSIVYWEVEIIG